MPDRRLSSRRGFRGTLEAAEHLSAPGKVAEKERISHFKRGRKRKKKIPTAARQPASWRIQPLNERVRMSRLGNQKRLAGRSFAYQTDLVRSGLQAAFGPANQTRNRGSQAGLATAAFVSKRFRTWAYLTTLLSSSAAGIRFF